MTTETSGAPQDGITQENLESTAQPEVTQETTTQQEAPTVETEVQRPEWLPEKFKSAEDMAKAYGELEKKLGQKPAEKAPEVTDDTGTDDGESGTSDEVKAFEGLDIDFTKLKMEIAQTGEVSEDTKKDLMSYGLPENVVNDFIDASSKTLVAEFQELYAITGDQKTFNAMIDWAVANLSSEQLAGYDAVIGEGNMAASKLAVHGLLNMYVDSTGKTPKLLQGRLEDAAGEGFRSQTEITNAINDPRYKEDPAYRSDVMRRINLTPANIG